MRGMRVRVEAPLLDDAASAGKMASSLSIARNVSTEWKIAARTGAGRRNPPPTLLALGTPPRVRGKSVARRDDKGVWRWAAVEAAVDARAAAIVVYTFFVGVVVLC